MKLLLATHNVAKVDEYKKYLKYLSGLELISLADLGITDDIDETGRTFKENALLKAEYYAQKTGLLAMGDDGGLEINALQGAPGVMSRRWPGYRANDTELIKYTLEQMKGIEPENRNAQFTAGLALYDPNSQQYTYFEHSVQGYIINEKPEEYIEGFPFRALLFVPQFKKLWQDLTEEEQDMINHRKRLCHDLIHYLQEHYL